MLVRCVRLAEPPLRRLRAVIGESHAVRLVILGFLRPGLPPSHQDVGTRREQRVEEDDEEHGSRVENVEAPLVVGRVTVLPQREVDLSVDGPDL